MKNKIIWILLLWSLSIFATISMMHVGGESSSSSINFYGEKTDVYLGEDIITKLSIVNLISNPKMYAQVIILPPSGMSVTSAIFTKTSAGQFTADFEIDPSEGGKEIEIILRPNQVGEFNVKGRVVYYFGNDKENKQDYPLDLAVSVRRPTVLTDVDKKNDQHKKGSVRFDAAIMGLGLIAFLIIFSVTVIYILRRH